MGRCRANKANGEPCKAPANGQHGYCWAHAPENAEERRKIASRGGRSSARANKELRDTKAEVRDIIGRIDSGDLDRNDAGVMLQGCRVLGDLIKLERSVRVEDELAPLLEDLKANDERSRPA
jgi:hypothetical protein